MILSLKKRPYSVYESGRREIILIPILLSIVCKHRQKRVVEFSLGYVENRKFHLFLHAFYFIQ